MKIVSKFSKSLIISLFVIGISIFTISSCDNISNTGTPDNKENPGNENDNIRYGTPCDKTLGNGNYILHNFIGEESNVVRANQIAKDMNYYLGKGETYVMDLVDKFSESLQDRPTAQAYFQEFINAQKANEFQTLRETMSNPYGFDRTVNGISNASEPVFENIIRNIDTNRDRALFIRCYQALSNEAYKYGLGALRNSSCSQMNYYNDVREDINAAWTAGTINNPFDINHDIDNQNCQQITNKMDSILNHTANNIGNDVTANDLRQVINIANTAYSLTAMENRAASALEHTGCAINLEIVDSMFDLANEMFWAEQDQSLGL
ncbi:MAG: hypothetical protein IJZ71_05655 [Treponema sp.]|nr:hypothetical protein [bacterium]MBQ8776948.1 hypothetical protein [Treponema sp.]